MQEKHFAISTSPDFKLARDKRQTNIRSEGRARKGHRLITNKDVLILISSHVPHCSESNQKIFGQDILGMQNARQFPRKL